MAAVTPRRKEPGQLQFVIHVGLAAFMVFLGGGLALMAVGLIQADEYVGLGPRIVAFLFGGGIAFLGVRFTLLTLRTLADAAGERDRHAWWLMGVRGLARRVDAQSLLAAVTLLPLVAGYWREVLGGNWWGPSQETLIGLVPIEFLLLHGFPFLAIAATFARLPDRVPRWIGSAAVAGLLLLYSAFAWGVFEGPSGVLALLYLSVPNVLAFARHQNDWTVRAAAGTRWGTKFILFFSVAMLLNERSFQGRGALSLGLWYFGILTVIELFRVAELPVDLAEVWARLPAQQRMRSAPLGTAKP